MTEDDHLARSAGMEEDEEDDSISYMNLDHLSPQNGVYREAE
ncbi:hypothetical protein ANO14919_034900 [Xylariales sp. No.14919]|nr:hypothetical protein ANO14919_034900 [Xylariales sp. No.14919]